MLNSNPITAKVLLVTLQVVVVMLSCSNGKTREAPEILASGFTVISGEDTASRELGKYLFEQLSGRCHDNRLVLLGEKENGYNTIKVIVNSSFGHDYCIDYGKDDLILKGRDNKTAKWLILQFVKHLSEKDNRFDAADLPPAIINIETGCSDFDFSYREPYFSPNTDRAYTDVLGTHMLEEDWGIWGHNLVKILKPGVGSSIFATVNGVEDTEQFCFSSDEIFKQLKEYIIDNYGNGNERSQQFMIMPTDYNLACNCSKCASVGNTTDNATPAVSKLIGKLAVQFPNHSFFTTAYLTTRNPPVESWPRNTGVMISTIDLPKGVALYEQKSVKEFIKLLSKWKQVTDKVYIWDYAANFDDYLTPLPVLYGLQTQLSFYKKNGITGVFLNASGYDYSPFDDVKSYVSAALMKDCSLPVDSLCDLFFSHYYPMTGKVLNDYYLSLEKKQQSLKKPYRIYAGFGQALNSYLDPSAFMTFYGYIGKIKDKAKGDEKDRLQKLFIAISYTRLQLGYYLVTGPNGFAMQKGKKLVMKNEIKEFIKCLGGYEDYDDLYNYKEFGGKIESYLNNWRDMFMKSHFRNLLMGEEITALTKLDEEYHDLQMLNDGVTGFEADYHQGWFINSANHLHIEFNAANLKATRRMILRFLTDKKHQIHAPVKLEIFKDNKLYKTITPQDNSYHIFPNSVEVSEKVDLSDAGIVSLKIFKNTASKSIACDEIQLTN